MNDPDDPTTASPDIDANTTNAAQDAPPPASPATGNTSAELPEKTADSNPRSSESPKDKFLAAAESKRESLDDHDPEESLWTGGYSPKAMIGSWVMMSILSVSALIASLVMGHFLVSLAVIGALWVITVGVYLRRRLGVHYELTSQRFIHKRGILTRRTDRIEVIDIDDVAYEQGPVQRIFGVGKITVTSSDRTDPELTLLGIDRVSEVAGLIDDIRRTERRRRSLHIESI
ncbi:MAG: PH domain-containing protein [Planctomycetota bacterium]